MMKFLLTVFVYEFLVIVVKSSTELIENDQNRSDEALIVSENDSVSGNNYMYLYKSGDQFVNYLNYRAVYGLRYRPTRKNLKHEPLNFNPEPINYKPEPSNYNIVTEKNNFATISSEIISANETETENVNEEDSASSDIESEILSVTESSLKLPALNFTQQNVEPDVDESRNHIMRPNNRVEHALDFLAERLKKLLYYSSDKTRPESKVSPHLTTLGKFLNLFSLIKFENIPCVTAHKPLRQLSGTCYNEVECFNLGGIAVDRCANGFGVCCVFKGSCGSVTHQNVTYFESPNFPQASQNNYDSCSLTVLLARDVKQVLVDFLFFELSPPTAGNCDEDRFVVTGQAMNFDVPEICGIATGQHMFVDVENSEKIQFHVLTTKAAERAFSIKVTQLRENLAPQGCLQYHTNSEGLLKTFNYDTNSQITLNRRPSYFNNLNYAICIKRNQDFCSIIYTNEIKEREDKFELINLDEDGNVIPNEGQAGAEIFSCQDDYIAVNYVRLCGSKLNDGSMTTNFNINVPVQSYINGPIVIPFKTNNNTVGRGFQIYYFQEKCVT